MLWGRRARSSEGPCQGTVRRALKAVYQRVPASVRRRFFRLRRGGMAVHRRVMQGARRRSSALRTRVVQSQTSLEASDAFVVAGRRLHLQITGRGLSGDASARVVLRPVGTPRRGVEFPADLQRGRARAAVPLDDEAFRCTGPIEVRLRVRRRLHRVKFGVPAESGPVRRTSPCKQDGLQIVPTKDRDGMLSLQASGSLGKTQVGTVDVTPGRLMIAFSVFLKTGTTPVGIGYVVGSGCRDLRCELVVKSREPFDSLEYERWQLSHLVPTARLAAVLEASARPICEVWEPALITTDGRFRLRRDLDDIRDPRQVSEYRTTVDTVTPGRHRFRPYWTPTGDLAIEHTCGVKA